jgi:hypothetical protein
MEVGPFARMVVNGWYKMGRSLFANTGADTGNPFAAIYLSGSSLDTSMLHGDLLAGLASRANPGGDLTTTVVGFIEGLNGGLSTLDRLRARAMESALIVQWLIGDYNKVTKKFGAVDVNGYPTSGSGWIGAINALADTPGSTFRPLAPPTGKVSGFGMTEAPRGALAHFVTIENNKISAYQCVVPTTWNGSPKATGTSDLGAIERAMIDITFTTVADSDFTSVKDGSTVHTIGGVEALRVAQSFDPCIACAVH